MGPLVLLSLSKNLDFISSIAKPISCLADSFHDSSKDYKNLAQLNVIKHWSSKEAILLLLCQCVSHSPLLSTTCFLKSIKVNYRLVIAIHETAETALLFH